ncbi:MAG TPA: ABC transporter permease [Gemmatimonadaceae bacterium]|jgi:predicted permease
MSRRNGIQRLLQVQRGTASVDRAVSEELQFHFDMTLRELMATGMNQDEARKEAERRFGDVQRTRERLATIDRSRVGQERRAEWWNAFTQDLRYALRGIRLKPGFAASVIITLGLGIGANATMFGIVDRLLFRAPSLIADADRTGRIYLPRSYRGKESLNSYIGYHRFLDIKGNTKSFDAMTPYYVGEITLGRGDATKKMNVGVGDPDLWRMFDVKPVVGRFFGDDDNNPRDPHNVVVLSYGYWQTRFGGRRDVVGEKIDAGSVQYTVIGVAPDGFNGFDDTSLLGFMPIASKAAGMSNGKQEWYETYHMSWFESFARRKPGVSIEAANADLTRAHEFSYQKQLDAEPNEASPMNLTRPRGFLASVLHARGPSASNESKVATWLAGVALIVLLIACANVANLLLARALKRRREIAVRIALGVSRTRLLMQLVTESLLLALLGAVAGLVIAQWGGAIMRRFFLDENTIAVSAFADRRLLLFVALLATVTGLITGLAPAFQLGRGDIAATLKVGAREGTVHRSPLRIGLLIAQAALSVVLLVGAGLFVRSLVNVNDIRLGYDADQLLWIDMNYRGMKIDSIHQIALRQQLLDRVKTVPGVENASRALTVPFNRTWSLDLFVPGIDSVSKLGDFTLQAGSPEIFATMGTRILRGRGFTPADRADAPRVIVINEAMAKKIWPGQDPIGKTMRIDRDSSPVTAVIGLAEDVRRGSISEPEAHYYIPIDQFRYAGDGLFVRTTGDASAYVETVRHALQPLMPGISYVTATPMTKIMEFQTRSWRLGATMFAVFGGLALVLAAIGLYSVIAYNVTQRMHEMGVRVALGAQARDVIHLIVREGLAIVLPGIALGVIVALVASRWIAPLLFNVSPKDPAVVSAVLATLITVAVAASWIPATRAARVDPNEALRAD